MVNYGCNYRRISELCQHHAEPSSPPSPPPPSSSPLRQCLRQPEFAESVLVGIEHVPHVEAAGLLLVPLLQLLVVGVAG